MSYLDLLNAAVAGFCAYGTMHMVFEDRAGFAVLNACMTALNAWLALS